jgi:hypothetical protein
VKTLFVVKLLECRFLLFFEKRKYLFCDGFSVQFRKLLYVWDMVLLFLKTWVNPMAIQRLAIQGLRKKANMIWC